MKNILEVKNLKKNFGQVTAVENLSFKVRQGEILGLMGPNGAGKTTVFNLLTGAFKADNGRIFFNASDITTEPPHKRARFGIGRTYQIPYPFEKMIVFENLLVCGNVLVYGNENMNDVPVVMTHFLRPVADGSELRSRFWFGWQIIDG